MQDLTEMNNVDLEKEIQKIGRILIYEKGYICAVDMILRLKYLSKKDYEDWRFGRVRYLERVCKVNLSKLSTINKMIRKMAIDLQLDKSWTAYNQYGKGVKRKLTFSKSGNSSIEDAYATHYIDKNRISEIKLEKASVYQK